METVAMEKIISIGDRKIGAGQPAYVIAEIGANHNGDLAMAKELIAEAKRVGCDCAKFQTFTADEFCADPDQIFTYNIRNRFGGARVGFNSYKQVCWEMWKGIKGSFSVHVQVQSLRRGVVGSGLFRFHH